MHVRAHTRDGHPVAAHVRSNRARAGSDGANRAPGEFRFGDLPLRRKSLLDDDFIVLASGRRRQPGGAGGADASTQDTQRSTAGAAKQGPSPRSQELVDILAPGGQPLGVRFKGAEEPIRTLPGGLRAAEAMLQRLISGRGAVEVTPRGYEGRMYRLNDGSIVGLRPASRSGGPSLDVNIPGLTSVTKIHFTD